MENDTSFPESYICPLTQEVMRDPVVDPEGNSYERTAIEAWLRKNSTSPITRAPLSSKDLVPNRALRDAIQQRCAELNVTLEPLPESKASSASSASASSSSSSAAASSSTTTTATGPVTMTISSRKDPSQQDITEVLISIQPQDSSTSSSSSSSTSRAPIDICCVVDVSGSMGTEATMKKADGGVERHGLSLLDVVKHAVKTIVSALQPNDRLGLVVYSTEARTISGLTAMTEGAKQQVINKLEALTPEDTTNLWDGLQMGMDMLRKHATPPQQEARSHRRLQAVLLLTDGLPNISPPRGELAMMKRYMDQHGADLLRNSCSLHTFGFGYGINSQLLRDLAIEGDGSYSFIPDSSFVGTVFVHAVSNLLATMATGARLALEPLGGQVGFVDGEQGIMGGHLCRAASWGVTVNLCSLQYGQSKDLVLRMKDVPAGGEEAFLSATLKYVPVADGAEDGDAVEVRAEATPSSVAPEVELIVQRARLRLVEALSQAMLDMKAGAEDSARARVKGLADSLELDNFQRSEPRLKALLEDVSGQVTEAFSRKDWYDRWGVHYLYSLIRAHQLQTCNNFKDPGVQFYGGGLFGALRDQIDDLFCKLPPPKPSRAAARAGKHGSGGSSGRSLGPAVLSSMSTYHNRSNPCFHGDCLVRMADGTQRPVRLLQKGDKVASASFFSPSSSSSSAAEVVCILKTTCEGGRTDLVRLPSSDLLVTPFHPIRVDGKWRFPCELAPVTPSVPCEAVYSFLLSKDHVMVINGVECVGLGHCFQDDPIVAHPYFGSERVVEDLRRMPGWREGLVPLEDGCLVKDPKTGLVCGFHQLQAVSC